ncbi:MAG: sulfite exporter TauE/SafE family protein [Gammaproteobacteria bacterium]|jgi:cytochrome c biogenesis protein CcdA|nr:sulfite exporter TauE/SafE family protein [Gammaproteobacteria bacterium]
MEPVALGFFAALTMGLVYGAGACNVACLPYLGPVFLHEGSGWRTVVPFSLGRLLGYASLGAVAGVAGNAATRLVDSSLAAWLLGGATVLAGLSLVRGKQGCKVKSSDQSVMRRAVRPLPYALFAMGAGMAFNPCLPLGTVLLAAAATAEAGAGAALGLAFGLGAVVVPAIVFGALVARFGAQVRAHVAHWRGRLETGAGVSLIALGTVTLLGWIKP